MKTKSLTILAALGILALGNKEARATITIDLVTVGNAGNAADSTGFGAVSYVYDIATKEVNLFQYTEFLNAVDPSGSNSLGLYRSELQTNLNIAGISYTAGAASGSKYAVIGSGNRPVTYVSWNDSARFVNWLQNGQGSGSTETGVYNMSLGTPTRSGSATYWIPSENEWYKAAYYSQVLNGGTGGYWLYATQSNSGPGNTIGSGANQANFNNGVFSVTQSGIGSGSQNYLTDGGAFSESASYYGTYDQAGNVREWNETVLSGSTRGFRGGDWRSFDVIQLRSPARYSGDPTDEGDSLGFRVASVPEPSTMGLLALVGAGWMVWKRRRVTL